MQLIREDFLGKAFSGRWLAKKIARSAPVFASRTQQIGWEISPQSLFRARFVLKKRQV